MNKTKFLILALFVLVVLMVGSFTIPALAWFDREEDGYSYQRSSGPDPKVCGNNCGDANHDWLGKSKFDANYNFIGFEPPKAGYTDWLGVSSAHASELPTLAKQNTFTLSRPDLPFTIQVAKDNGHIRAYVEVDFSTPAGLQAYVQWNIARAPMLSANLKHPCESHVPFAYLHC